MTSNYTYDTNSILRRLNYGMPSFGYHTNYFLSENYSSDKSSQVDKLIGMADPVKSSDVEFLDTVLADIDGKERSQVIENMIQERKTLTDKVIGQIETAKDHLRDMKYLGSYSQDMGIPVKDITKLYNDLLRLSRDEETKAWKDISFLKVKLWEEGMTGGESNEDPQV